MLNQVKKASTSFVTKDIPDADPQEGGDLKEDPEIQQKREFCTSLVAQGLQLRTRQRGKAGRPNFKQLSLMARCL